MYLDLKCYWFKLFIYVYNCVRFLNMILYCDCGYCKFGVLLLIEIKF